MPTRDERYRTENNKATNRGDALSARPDTVDAPDAVKLGNREDVKFIKENTTVSQSRNQGTSRDR